MNGNETCIVSDDSVKHRFVFEYNFWSFDNIQSLLATEEHVYTSLAQPLLDWSFEGYNTCLFAYGQVSTFTFVHIRTYCFYIRMYALHMYIQ